MSTSRYRNYWYNIALTMIRRYPNRLAEEDSIISWNFYHAIERAINELKEKHPEDFSDRLKALNMMYFKGNASYTEVEIKLHVSRRTAQYWVNDFVYRVGKQAGFGEMSK